MKENYYPLLEDFIKDGRLFEATKEELASLAKAVAIPKIEEMTEAISPYTGKKINVKKVKEEMEKAKYKIVTQSALYRPFVHEMTPTIYTWLVPTMGTDGVRLFVNPEFAESLSWMGKIFVLIHEIFHCILMHQERGQGFDQKIFNIAGDFEINAIIVDTTDDFTEKFVLEEIQGLYDKKYLNIPVEQIYRDLLKHMPKLPPPPPNSIMKIDPTKKPQKAPPGPPQPPQPPQKGEIIIKPGVKVRIKATGQKGIVTKVNKDGTYEVDPINESLIMPKLVNEGYKRDEIIPILPKGEGGGGGGSPMDIQGEYEIEKDGEEEKGKEKGAGQGEGKKGEKGEGEGSGGGDKEKAKELVGKAGQMGKAEKGPQTQEEVNNEQRRIMARMENIDQGRAGAIIDTRTGEQIARASGYDEDEINAGADGRSKWEANAREMMRSAEKSKQAGSGRGDALINALGKILKPVTDWKTQLKIFVGSALAPEKVWRVGAKKHLHKSEEYLKRGAKPKKDAIKKVVVAIDSSGSMFSGSVTAFERAVSEINHIIFARKIKEIIVIFFDDGVDPGSIQKIKRGTKVWKPKAPKAGGGTNFQKPLDWIRSTYNDAINLCIFLTDGYADMPATPKYSKKFIWVVYDNDGFKAPFGKLINVASSEM